MKKRTIADANHRDGVGVRVYETPRLLKNLLIKMQLIKHKIGNTLLRFCTKRMDPYGVWQKSEQPHPLDFKPCAYDPKCLEFKTSNPDLLIQKFK